MSARPGGHGPYPVAPAGVAEPATGVLAVRDLAVTYGTKAGPVRALDSVDLTIHPGDRLGLVGESGSGKTTLGLALAQLLPGNASTTGAIHFEGQDLVAAPPAKLRRLRGAEIGMVFQDAAMSFNPVRTVGAQIVEAIRTHEDVSRRDARDRAVDLLTEVDVPRPAERLRQYPHQLSGGQRQRAMIAMALASSPKVLVADEPTSALDVTTQAGVIDLLVRLSEERRMATLLITHDLGVVARFATDVMVLYAGRAMERAPSEAAMLDPAHPYTADLVASVPQLTRNRLRRLSFIGGQAPSSAAEIEGCVYQPRCPIGSELAECRTTTPAAVRRTDVGGASLVACHRAGEYTPAVPDPVAHQPSRGDSDDPVLRVEGVGKTFRLGRLHRGIRAVASVSLDVRRGESFGIVGESGSGKTTLARIIVGLETPDEGRVSYRPAKDSGARPRPQMVFQDPAGSLNPLMAVQELVTEPLLIAHGRSRTGYRAEAEQLLDAVGLSRDFLRRRSAQLSGGQRQRVAIARALSTEPELIVADEAVSALDMSARGQILNLLADLREQVGVAFLHISHDLSMVRHVCDRVAVMQAGEIVELGGVEELFRSPQHPYTQLLIDSVPSPDPVRERTRRRPFTRVVDPAGPHRAEPA